ncbi:proton-conducting transporter transmembrane domain-containing protein [Pyrococcus kukulkanii]|uniref:proton-conducting transporter transmembrane domain-containing protein n=1 Tax=Pyrococcus kukulkanii TaxID=1609559 RepID=UPI003562B509
MNPIPLAVLTPIAFAFTLPLIGKLSKSVAKAYAVLGTFLTMLFTFEVFKSSGSGPLTYTFGGWRAPIGIVYEVDTMSAFLGLVTSTLLFLIAIYSLEYIKSGEVWYFTLYLGLEAGLIGVLYTGDLFNLFVMLEVTSVAAYALVMFNRDLQSLRAGLKYAFIGAIGTTLYFIAMGLLYRTYGTLNMAQLAEIVHSSDVVNASLAILLLATWAFLIKAAIFPNHFWLPDAHPAAPSPISAVLSGLVVNVGIYSIARLYFTLYSGLPEVKSLGTLLIILGAISAFLGAIMMNVHSDIKRIIAYSTIMHMGYLSMALGIGSSLALASAVFHTFNHAVAKSLLFLSAGIMIQIGGSRDLRDLAGIGRTNPLAMFSFAVAALSLAGIPPLNVFSSKVMLFTAFLDWNPALAGVLIVTSIMSLVAYVKMMRVLWLGCGKKESVGMPVMTGVVVAISIAVIVLGLVGPWIFKGIALPAVAQGWESYVAGGLGG